MSLNTNDVKKIAHLARLNFDEAELNKFASQLSNILDFVEQMSATDTENIQALAHSMDLNQPLRPDLVTEINERTEFQKIAPQVEAGLYLVPQVIEG